MYDKQKMMQMYVLAFPIVIAAKIIFESARMSASVTPHLISACVVLVVIWTLLRWRRVKPTVAATTGLLLVYALDVYFSILDNHFLNSLLVFMVLPLIAGALLEKAIVLITLVGCNVITLAYFLLWPNLALATLHLSQIIHMMILINVAGILMYLATSWATGLIESGNQKTAEANRANAAKSRFLASISHEIRTPMNAIFGMNELILSAPESADPMELKQKATYIKTAGIDLLALINDILDISKMDQGKMSLLETPYNAMELLNAAGRELSGLIGIKPLTPRVSANLSIARDLVGDDVGIRQILSKLLNNAVKFTPEGTIELGAEQLPAPEGIMLRMFVRDTGCGLSEENIAAILRSRGESYFKESNDFGGIGIGLSIVIRLLYMMNGTLEIESEIGKGSTFIVSIPQRISEVPVQATAPTAPAGRPTLSGARVLVVDDNNTNIQVSRGIFKRYALDIDTALSGREALAKAEKTPYDLIFMDHMMPGMDGLQTLQAIRQLGDDHNTRVPVVVLTADNSQELEQSMLKSGFDAYLCKPIDTIALTRILRTYLGSFINPEKLDKTAPQYALGRSLPGINVQKGIQNSGGTLEMYLKVLRILERTGPQQAQTLSRTLEREDLNAFEIEVHALKSVADNIGAARLRTMSANLEMQARAGNLDGIKAGIGPLLSELQKIVESVSAALKEITQKPPPSPRESLDLDDLLERMRKLCAAATDYDLDTAGGILSALSKCSFSPDISAALEDIGAEVKSYSYASTIERTQQLILHLEGQTSKGGVDA